MEKLLIGAHIESYPYEESKLNIYNSNTGKTFVLGEKESQVFRCLNGVNTIADIQRDCPFYSHEEIEKLIAAFSEIGLFDKQKKKFNPLKIKLRLCNPNRILKENSLVTKVLHNLILIGSPLLLIAGLLMMRFRLTDTGAFIAGVMASFSGIRVWDGILIAILSLLCLSLHEIAHMVTARRYGVNVPEIGVMLYCLIPCAYTNISGINLLKSKGKRLMVLLSGSLVNLGIIGLCYLVTALISSPILHMYAAALMLVNLGTIFMNTMVLLKFDGYYILETILDEPKFREKAIAHVADFFKIIFSKNKEAKRALAQTLQDGGALLLHVTYCFYAVLSVAYVPFVLLNTVIPFFFR